jgi:predicted RNase H-like HicB family nuclease
MTLTVEVHDEDGVLWGQVVELPGCFATGETLDELTEALGEAIALYQADTQRAPITEPRTHERSGRYRVDRLTLVGA